ERDRVCDEQDEGDEPQVEPRLPAVADLVAVDPGAPEAHVRSLRRGVNVHGDAAGNEARLRRWREGACRGGPEGGADRLPCEGAEARSLEVAIGAGWAGTLAHCCVCSGRTDPASEER